MVLYIIGIGLNNEKDITLKGLEAVKSCDKVFLETYTNKLACSLEDLEKSYGKDIIPANRDIVEKQAEELILAPAKEKNIALLIIGDALSATTHTDLITRAKELNIEVEIIHNATVFNAIALTGLQLYKFGKTTSVPFPEPNFKVETPYNIISQNNSIKAHTLVLLDLRPDENKYMTGSEAIKILLNLEKEKQEKVFSEETFCVICADLGGKNIIKQGKAKDLVDLEIKELPQCLIVPSEMHFMEKEFLEKLN